MLWELLEVHKAPQATIVDTFIVPGPPRAESLANNRPGNYQTSVLVITRARLRARARPSRAPRRAPNLLREGAGAQICIKMAFDIRF